MEIITVTPRGFCKGVVKAIQMAKDAAKSYPNQRITILGELVHNRYVVTALQEIGIETLESKDKSRQQLLDEVHQGVVIFSAHGVNPKLIAEAKAKGLTTLDASCEDVIATQNLVLAYLENNFSVLYVGQKKHPEAEAILSLNQNDIHFITHQEDLDHLPLLKEKIFITNQTTMSILDIKEILEKAQALFPQAIISDEICSATRLRQEAILKLEQIDFLIVVGDQQSNNSKMLAKIGLGKGIPQVKLVQSAYDLIDIDLKKFQRIAITAGASTPTYLVNQVTAYCKAMDQGTDALEAIQSIKPFI